MKDDVQMVFLGVLLGSVLSLMIMLFSASFSIYNNKSTMPDLSAQMIEYCGALENVGRINVAFDRYEIVCKGGIHIAFK